MDKYGQIWVWKSPHNVCCSHLAMRALQKRAKAFHLDLRAKAKERKKGKRILPQRRSEQFYLWLAKPQCQNPI